MMVVFVWLLCFFLLIGLIALVIFQVMCLADLEFDYINPYDTASRINKVMVPEFILQGVLSLVLLFTGHWIMFLLSLPFVYYDYNMYQNRQHLIDVTEIYNHVYKEKKRRVMWAFLTNPKHEQYVGSGILFAVVGCFQWDISIVKDDLASLGRRVMIEMLLFCFLMYCFSTRKSSVDQNRRS